MAEPLFTPCEGSRIDLAPFGRRRCWSGTAPREIRARPWHEGGGPWAPRTLDDAPAHLGIEWDEPRDIAEVVVVYDPVGGKAGSPPRLEYWQRNWPWAHRDSLRGAHRGWTGRDDAFHGSWRAAAAETVEEDVNRVRLRVLPLDWPEVADVRRLHDAEDFLPEFRRALKIRLCWDDPGDARVIGLAALAGGTWRLAALEVCRVPDGSGAGEAAGPILRADTGYLLDGDGAPVRVVGLRGDEAARVPVRVLHTGVRDPVAMATTLSWDAGDGRGAAVCVDEVLEEGGVWIRDLGLLIRPGGLGEEPAATCARLTRDRPATIHERVGSLPEQTVERAFAETPRLAPAMQHPPLGRYVVLGHEGNRAEFGVRFNGNVFVSKPLSRLRGRDAAGLHWPGAETAFRFGTGDPPDFRECEGPWRQSFPDPGVPILETRWVDRGVAYVQTCLAVAGDVLPDHLRGRGDEDLTLLVRFDLASASAHHAAAVIRLEIDPPEVVALRDGVLLATGRLVRRDIRQNEGYRWDIVAPWMEDEFAWRTDSYDEPRARATVDDDASGSWELRPGVFAGALDGRTADANAALVYRCQVEPGTTRSVVFAIPFRTPKGAPAPERVDVGVFDRRRCEAESFWTRLAESGMSLQTGDALLDGFFRAALPHVMITADRDPGSGVVVLPAATLAYGACGNEACLQIRQVDYRGYHAFAEACLDAFLVSQGKGVPDGDFSSADGWFQGVEVYDGQAEGAAFGYNLDHGFVLSCLAEHYLLTRDGAWLRRVAPHLVDGCAFVSRERRATMVETDGDRSPAWGLLPAGHLEDNPEWRHWFAVNAHAHLGMRRCAEALAEIGHPESGAIAREAAAYREDIVRTVRRARLASPAARLFDGASVPHVPPRTHLRGPDWGWFREGAYGPLHLVDGEVLDPDDPTVAWILKYLEDRVFIDRDLGRPADTDGGWFSLGGVTIQPNLLNNAVAYLRRDEIGHAVRAMYNTFALSLYTDVLVFTEHAVREPGRGTGPYYKTPDECGFLNTLRRFFVHEEGTELWLGRATPRGRLAVGGEVEVSRAATWFGPVSYALRVESERTVAQVEMPTRNPPSRVRLRIRRADACPVGRVEVNGRVLDRRAVAGETIDLDPALGARLEIVAAAGEGTG